VAATAAPAKEATVPPSVALPSHVLTVPKNLIAKISS
jgi:hypothetical protein